MGRVVAFLASRNPHKLDELQALLPSWELVALDLEYPPEAGRTYHDNAYAKALFGLAAAPPGARVVGEDSGIEVTGLGGRPGVEAARFGGDDPVGRLLAALDGIEGDGRRARYRCELVCLSEGYQVDSSGTLEGRIAHEPRGSEGFGYDPIFVPDGETRTVAELGNAWKCEHSHRARAARGLAEALGL